MLLENLENMIVDHRWSFEARLAQLCRQFGFDHASYAHVNRTVGVISGFTTYPAAWVLAYTSLCLYEEDPIVIHGPDFTGPVDWAEFREDPRYQAFFECSERNGVGGNGITIPLTSPCGEAGLLSVVKDCDLQAWRDLTEQSLPDLCREAQNVHVMALDLSPVESLSAVQGPAARCYRDSQA